MIKTTLIQEESALWLKGNLHCHSTISDGRVTPEGIAEGYARKGYDFLAITDHDIFMSHDEIPEELIITLPAMELTGPITEDKNGHFGVIQKGQAGEFSQGQRFALKSREETIDFLKAHHENYLLILNHPYWSLLEWEEVMDLPYLNALEIYNHATQMGDFVGEATHFWNTLQRKGKYLWGVAADDSHNRMTNVPGWPFDTKFTDSLGGWVCVKAKERSREAITEALETGSFYASTGPEIYDFYIQDNMFYVKCSPCQRIVVSGDRGYFQRKIGESLVEFSGQLKGKEKFLRVQCADERGGVAYSNPIYI